MSVPAAKLRGLRELLERDGVARFKGGAVVTWTAKQEGAEGEHLEGRVEVERPSAPGAVKRWPDDDDGLRRAYEWALHGSPPVAQPSSSKDFGEQAPW